MTGEKTKRVVLVFFGLIVAVLIIEGVLRFLGWGFLYLQERRNTQPILSKDVQINQTGDIQTNWAGKKEFVVICLGESTTMLGAENSWPRQLQLILNSVQDQRTFRVINKGLAGRDTTWMLENLPNWLDTYSPDFVLAMAGINDRSMAHCDIGSAEQCDQRGGIVGINNRFDELLGREKSSSQFWWTTLLSHSRTYGLLEWIAGGIKARFTEETDVVGEGGNSENLAIYGLVNPNVTHLLPMTIRNLNAMVNLSTDRGITFGFVQYALRQTDILRNAIERQQNVIYISNHEIFRDLLTQHNYEDLFIDDFAGDFGHTTEFGYRIIADNVARELLKLFELQERSD